jgi:DNA-binding NarL/FixJ family response regulator
VVPLFKCGKKNHEIAEILSLMEKQLHIQMRLLTKLNVTNLVDLVEKAKETGNRLIISLSLLN